MCFLINTSHLAINFGFDVLEIVNLPEETVEKGVAEGTLVDYSWKGHQLSCTTMASIKQVVDKHCLLDVSPSAVERLHALQVYPIVLFIKFKSSKHIRFVTQFYANHCSFHFTHFVFRLYSRMTQYSLLFSTAIYW